MTDPASPPPTTPPAVPNYRASSVPQRRAFAYQAAQFSFWAPLVVIGAGLCITTVLNRPGAGNPDMARYANLTIAAADVLVMISGLAMGIVALCAIPRLGGKDLLFRALLGIGFSLYLALSVAYPFFTDSPSKAVAKRLVGEWTTTAEVRGGGTIHSRLVLQADGVSRWQVPDAPTPIDIPGRWGVGSSNPQSSSAPLVLEMKFDKALETHPPMAGRAWRLDHVTDTQLDLTASDAEGKPVAETYMRTGK